MQETTRSRAALATVSTARNRRRRDTNRVLAALALSGSTVVLTTGWAADLPADTQLKEIVVTAQKRSENLEKVPISVTAFTASTLKDLHVTNISEIANYTPDLQFTTGASGTADAANFFIRGIGQDDFITTTDPGVGVYLDGVYLARATGSALDLADIERVEVLRGPQGTLFGRNTIGGAINVITAQPTGNFDGHADITAGNQQTLDGGVFLDFPVIPDRLAGNIAFMSNNTAGWGENVWPGADNRNLGQLSNVATRAQLLLKATDRLQFDASFDYTEDHGTSLPHGLVAFTPTAGTQAYNATASVPIGPQYITANPDHIEIDTPTRNDMQVYGTALTGTWRGDALSVKSISAFRTQNGLSGQDYDGTPAAYLDQVVNFNQKQFSQELQAYGNALADRLKWLGGLYYFTESAQFNSDITLSDTPILISTHNRTDSSAAYGQSTLKLTDSLSVTAGARWTSEKKQIDVSTVYGGLLLIPETHREATFSNTSPMGSIQYQLTPNEMLYASVARGFRSGGFNGRPFAQTDLTAFGPETVTSYETGIKAQWRRVRINADGYYADYRDIQVTATTTDAAGNFIVVTGNAARASIYGGELEAEVAPAAGVRLFGSLGITENSVRENPGFSFGARELPDTSRLNFSLGGDYTVHTTAGASIRLGGDYDYRSGFYPQYNEAAPSYVRSYGLLSAHLVFAPEQSNWMLTLYGKNLTNRIYWTFGQTAGSGDVTVAWFGPTRQWGATLEFHF